MRLAIAQYRLTDLAGYWGFVELWSPEVRCALLDRLEAFDKVDHGHLLQHKTSLPSPAFLDYNGCRHILRCAVV